MNGAPKTIDVRRCLPEDCAKVAALGKSVWGDWANGQILPRQLIDIGHPVFVAHAARDEIVGYCVGLDEAGGRTGYIFSVTLHPACRKMGLGNRLVGSVVDVFRGRKMSAVNAAISDENTASKALFAKLGFRETRRMENYYEAGDVYCRYTSRLD